MNHPLIWLEAKTFLGRAAGLCAFALVIALSAYALLTGGERQREYAAAQTEFEAAGHSGLEVWREALVQVEVGESVAPREAQPMDIQIPAVLPPAALGDFSAGPADMLPVATRITPWRNSANLFANYQFANPTTLEVGRFDMSFVIVVLMPLLMVAVSFGALAAERERGTLGLVAAQPVRLSAIVWTRLVLRNALLWTGVVLVALAAATLNAGAAPLVERMAWFAVWMVAALAYGAFWLGLIALVVAWIKRSEATAAVLVMLWGIFVLGVPALASALDEALYPPPSRLAHLSEMRQAQGEANREIDRLSTGFLMNHPELTVSDEAVPAFYRSAYLANLLVEERTATIQQAYDTTWTNRHRLMAKMRYASPAVIARQALDAVAGADFERYLRFQTQARRALSELSELVGPAVVTRNRISLEQFDTVPLFRFGETSLRDVAARAAIPLGYLVLLAVGLMVFANRRVNAPLEKSLF